MARTSVINNRAHPGVLLVRVGSLHDNMQSRQKGICGNVDFAMNTRKNLDKRGLHVYNRRGVL